MGKTGRVSEKGGRGMGINEQGEKEEKKINKDIKGKEWKEHFMRLLGEWIIGF